MIVTYSYTIDDGVVLNQNSFFTFEVVNHSQIKAIYDFCCLNFGEEGFAANKIKLVKNFRAALDIDDDCRWFFYRFNFYFKDETEAIMAKLLI